GRRAHRQRRPASARLRRPRDDGRVLPQARARGAVAERLKGRGRNCETICAGLHDHSAADRDHEDGSNAGPDDSGVGGRESTCCPDAIREELDRILDLLCAQPEIGTMARRATYETAAADAETLCRSNQNYSNASLTFDFPRGTLPSPERAQAICAK